MSHSLRVKIKGLQYKGIITDKDCDRLCKALDNEGVLDKIREEIEKKIVKIPWLDFKGRDRYNDAFLEVLDIIDKYNRK